MKFPVFYLVIILVFFTVISGQNFIEPELDWAKHFASGIEPSYDAVTAIDCDDFGNIYIAGIERPASGMAKIITIKYNSQGKLVWKNSLEKYRECETKAVGVDSEGNVYVTGSAFISDTSRRDFITIKYNSFGIEEWIRLYNGPDNSSDYTKALTTDNVGNVYITGLTSFLLNEKGNSISTIKYNPEGIKQWVVHYRGPVSSRHLSEAIKVDNVGNVYITGQTSFDGDTDYLTIKYNKDGYEEWTKTYQAAGDSYDTDLDISNSGNVYVTGYSTGDYVTIKYDTDGMEKWIRTFDRPNGGTGGKPHIAVDDSENVYVAGYSEGKLATIKYSSIGNQDWVASFDYQWPDYYCFPRDIDLDPDGNIYVAGYSTDFTGDSYVSNIIKLNSSGHLLWSNNNFSCRQGSAGIVANNNGDIFISGTGLSFSESGEFVTIKYNTLGQEQWTTKYNGQGCYDSSPRALVHDEYGNLYVTGNDYAETGDDYVTIKYNDQGDEQWIIRKSGSLHEEDIPRDVKLDSDGNIYVVGKSNLLKYNSAGIELWSVSPGYNSMAIDKNTNIFVSRDSAGGQVTCKYNKSGNRIWTRYNFGPETGARSQDYTSSIEVGNSGNVYVSGYNHGLDWYYGWRTIKYHNDGTKLWSLFYSPDYNLRSAPQMYIDGSENIYVMGDVYLDGEYSSVVLKFDSAGVQQWETLFAGSGQEGYWGAKNGLVVDDSEFVYLAGTINEDKTDNDVILTKYNKDGAEVWTSFYKGSGSTNDCASGLLIDDGGNIYVVGYNVLENLNFDIVLIKYNSSGVQQWCKSYNGPSYEINAKDIPIDFAIDDSSNVYITGRSTGSYGTIFTTLKYSQTGELVDIFQQEFSHPTEYKLSQNYPNPFNPKTMISYKLPMKDQVDLSIYNIIGQKVATLVSEKQNTGSYKVIWDGSVFASGVYLYRLETDQGFTQTKKLILMK